MTTAPHDNAYRDLAGVTDDTIDWALQGAVVPPLLAALATCLDDLTLIPEGLRPGPATLVDPDAGLTGPQKAEAGALAREALRRWRDEGLGGNGTPKPPEATLAAVLEYLSGGRDVDGYLDLMREELALGEDRRAPQWTLEEVAPDRRFRVVVIGAGMSGLLAAHRLRQAGLDVTVVEKNHDVGGTWLDNSYPGCRVDVHNHFYSYTFAPRRDWPGYFSTQDVLLDYFRSVADEHDLRPLIRFGTEVTAVEYDEGTSTWTLQLLEEGGREATLEAEAVVSAVGQLNRPHVPTITGADRFDGPAFHSARWDHSVDLAGRRVAVIGTGASAAQFVPEIADEVAHLDVFQRTPAWFIPTPDYHDEVSAEEQWLFTHVPGYANWYRFWLFWANIENMLPAVAVEEGWDNGGASVGALNEGVRQLLVANLQAHLGDHPGLLAKVVPDYPPFAKRAIRDNGSWPAAITRDDVDLLTEPIDEIVADGVVTADGEHRPADVIIYGTGFTASDFLMPMKVVGRGGVDLHEAWGGDARAHLGVTLPGFPNLFLLYGPNTNIVVNGSITYFSECEMTHVLGCLEALLREGARALEPDREAHDAYNARVDEANLRMAWGVSSVNSWYKNATGRTAQNWPFSLLDYWRETRHVDLAQFRLEK
jgi:4-hydroxyacetophenone monooxygenase